MAEEIKKLANGLASLGRYEDSFIVHAAEGETVIPEEVFDENPSLKEDLYFASISLAILKDLQSSL